MLLPPPTPMEIIDEEPAPQNSLIQGYNQNQFNAVRVVHYPPKKHRDRRRQVTAEILQQKYAVLLQCFGARPGSFVDQKWYAQLIRTHTPRPIIMLFV